MSITILPLCESDRADWDVLWDGYLRFYRHELSAAQTDLTFARLCAATGPFHAAIARERDGRAVGIVHWLTHGSTWEPNDSVYLEDLFVAESARGSGVGRALITHVRDWAERHGHPKLYWHTATDNHTARRLYDQLGKQEFVVYEVDIPSH